MITFRINGEVREAESGLPVAGYWVKAYDKDLLFDDLLGTVVTGDSGQFEIVSEPADFREFFEQHPDLYVRIMAPDGKTEVFSTESGVRWHAGRIQKFQVRIPHDRLASTLEQPRLALAADEGAPREDFDVAEPLSIALSGVQPSSPHEVAVLDESGRELFVDRLISDARGRIEPTIVWPQIGLDDPAGRERLTVPEARARWKGRRIAVSVRHEGRELLRSEVRIAGKFTRPLVLSTDDGGRVLNGFEAGTAEAIAGIFNAPFDGEAIVYLVPRQYDWRTGDRFTPVRLASDRPAAAPAALKKGGDALVRVARARELAPGVYDFIVRRVRYGYEDDDDFVLRDDDLVGGRRLTGLVVRKEFWASKVIRGGCVNLLDIAGRDVGSAPYMELTNVFQVGENIYGALDPAALDPNHTSKMVALYVIPHKTASDWSADNSLQHLAVLGGNPAVQKFQTQSWCVNANRRLLWPNASQVGEYDVVADFGNNVPDAGSFASDAHYDMPLDIIDGYVQPGFRIVPDTTTDTSITNIGHLTYDQMIQGTITVSGDEDLGTVVVNRTASVYFPADVPGATTVAQASAGPFPLVVLVHGNATSTSSYLGYEYLLQHLAKNGFIAASIHMNPGMGGTGRARVLKTHLDLLRALFGAKVQNNIGIMGHSRGGEAVCIAARLNQQEAWGHGINAVISLAPTDQYTHETLGGGWAKPYLVIYGSMDGDLGYVWDNGFTLYDRANGAEKSFVFVYGAIHDRFNTVWGDGDLYFGELGGTDMAKVISADAHQKIAKGYMSAFFRLYLKNETQWKGMFRGEWVPAAASTADPKAKFYVQYEHPAASNVDNFEGPHGPASWQTSTIGAAVDDDNSLPVDPAENELAALDPQSPHDTAGLLLRWDGTADHLRFAVPAAQRDVRAYEALSFRITQKVGSAANPAGLPQDLRVSLTDTAGQTRAIMVSKFGEVPPPDSRFYPQFTKSALTTIRIPLSAYRILCLTVQEVDLANVASVAFEFSEKATGEIEIDSVQFTA